MIEFYDIYKIYKMGENEVFVLNGVSLKINVYEFVVIVGLFGLGKLILMNIIGCFDMLIFGIYILDGYEVSRFNDNQFVEI